MYDIYVIIYYFKIFQGPIGLDGPKGDPVRIVIHLFFRFMRYPAL